MATPAAPHRRGESFESGSTPAAPQPLTPGAATRSRTAAEQVREGARKEEREFCTMRMILDRHGISFIVSFSLSLFFLLSPFPELNFPGSHARAVKRGSICSLMEGKTNGGFGAGKLERIIGALFLSLASDLLFFFAAALASNFHLDLDLSSKKKQEATSRANPSANHHTPSPTARLPPPIPALSGAAAGKSMAASRGPFQSPPRQRRSVGGVFSTSAGKAAAAAAAASAAASRLPPSARPSIPTAAAAACDLLTPLPPARKRQRKASSSGLTPVVEEEGGVLFPAAAEAAAPTPVTARRPSSAAAAAVAAAAAAEAAAAASAAARPIASSSELDALEAALDSELRPRAWGGGGGAAGAGIEGVLSPPPRLTARMRAALLRRNSSRDNSLAAPPPPCVRAFSHPSFAATAASNGVVAFGELAAAGKAAREKAAVKAEREAAAAAAVARWSSRPKRGARK